MWYSTWPSYGSGDTGIVELSTIKQQWAILALLSVLANNNETTMGDWHGVFLLAGIGAGLVGPSSAV